MEVERAASISGSGSGKDADWLVDQVNQAAVQYRHGIVRCRKKNDINYFKLYIYIYLCYCEFAEPVIPRNP